MSSDPSSGRSRLQARLQRLLEEGSYYEASQVYLTLYTRHMGRGASEEAAGTLYEGAEVMLSRCQLESAEELAVKWAEHLRTHAVSAGEGDVERALALFNQLKTAQKESTAAIKLMRICIKWSQEATPGNGDPRLHSELGELLWALKRHPEARKHFLHAGQAESFALRVLDFSLREGYPGETGQFASQLVLGFLAEGYLKEAELSLRTFLSNHPLLGTGFPYKEHPLLNYNHMLLEVLKEESGGDPSPLERCQYLTEQYMTALQTDPSLVELLTKLNFLRAQPFRGMANPLSNLFPGGQQRLDEVDGLD